MVYSKNQRKKSLMMCIVLITLFILGATVGVSFAYFSDSAKAENTLNFGKLKIEMKDGTGTANTKIKLKPSTNSNLAVTDNVTITGTVGLEEGSVDAYIRMKIKAVDVEKGAEIESTFTNAFLTAMKDIASGDMKWFVVGDYLYLGNKIVAGTPFTYNSNQIELTDPMIPERFQGINVNIIFTFEAIQSAGMSLSLEDGYSQPNANKISGLDAWKGIEPELNAIYSGKYATEYVRGDLDETAYKTGAQVSKQMTKSPYDYFTRSKDNSKGNYVAFGFFPQTIKADDVVVKDSWKETFNGVEYYKGSDGYLYEIVKENAYYVNNLNYTYSNGEIISQASANSSKYFKLEPIIWEKRTGSNNSSVYVSVSELTAMCFYENGNNRTINGNAVNPNNYEYSYVRAFLNGLDTYGTNGTKNGVDSKYYYNGKGLLQKAFTETQKGLIEKNSASLNDKIFLLSQGEASEIYYLNNADRIKYPTDYAGANGIFKEFGENVGGFWWSRSTGSTNNDAIWYVHSSGALGEALAGDYSIGIVPVLLL